MQREIIIHDSSCILVNYHNYSKPNDKLSQKLEISLVVSTPPNDRLIAGLPTKKTVQGYKRS